MPLHVLRVTLRMQRAEETNNLAFPAFPFGQCIETGGKIHPAIGKHARRASDHIHHVPKPRTADLDHGFQIRRVHCRNAVTLLQARRGRMNHRLCRARRQYRQLHGAGIVAKIQGIDTPEDAAALRGAVALYRKDFPEAQENEYYWVDLIGCDVVNKEGQSIGRVKGMIDNGVHDILNVKRADGKEVLIPFVEDYLAEVNVETKKIIVDWDPSWD